MSKTNVQGYMRSDGVFVRPHTRKVEEKGLGDEYKRARIQENDIHVKSVDELTELPDSMRVWEVQRDLAPIPEGASVSTMDNAINSVINNDKQLKGGFTPQDLANSLHCVERHARYVLSGTTFIGLTEPYDDEGRYTLTPAGREYAALSPEEKKNAMGAMLCNTDEVWLREEDLTDLFGDNFSDSTLRSRLDNFNAWNSKAMEYLGESGLSPREIDDYAKQRRYEALINADDYVYAKNSRPEKQNVFSDLEMKSDEELCQLCFLYRKTNSDVCVSDGECGRPN